jgi:2-oxoglutarate dehydrogenase E2 component (dihydrolipoamide succinyltransferase)
MSTKVTMPQLGESVVEGTIAKWLVSEGDLVQEDQALVEVTTDKIDTEIPSPAAGVIGRILVQAGETVKVGTVLCEVEEARSGAPKRAPGPTSAAKAPASARPEPAGPARAPQAAVAGPTGEPSRSAPEIASRGAGASRVPPAAPSAERAEDTGAAAPVHAGAAAKAPVATSVRSAFGRPGVALDEERLAGARERRGTTREGAAGDGDGAAPGARRVTPVVRKMAAEHEVDLSRVTGTGIGGRVTKQDLLEYLASSGAGALQPEETYGDVLGVEAPPQERPAKTFRPAAPSLREAGAIPRAPVAPTPPAARPGVELREYAPPAVQALEGDRVEPFSKRRRIIAEHMVYSKATSPHVYTMAEIDMSGVAALRERSKRRFQEEEGVSLTYLHFVIAATVRALREVPRLNAVVGEDALIVRRDVNIGVAVETEQGLVVPVVKNADRLSLRGIARAVEELAVKARDRKLRLEDLQAGTFTISNPGREGNLVGFAVINQPQLGILRMGEIRKRPVVIEADGSDAIVVRPIMLMSLSYDHRVIDGVTGNSFLYRVREHLERADFEV